MHQELVSSIWTVGRRARAAYEVVVAVVSVVERLMPHVATDTTSDFNAGACRRKNEEDLGQG